MLGKGRALTGLAGQHQQLDAGRETGAEFAQRFSSPSLVPYVPEMFGRVGKTRLYLGHPSVRIYYPCFFALLCVGYMNYLRLVVPYRCT